MNNIMEECFCQNHKNQKFILIPELIPSLKGFQYFQIFALLPSTTIQDLKENFFCLKTKESISLNPSIDHLIRKFKKLAA